MEAVIMKSVKYKNRIVILNSVFHIELYIYPGTNSHYSIIFWSDNNQVSFIFDTQEQAEKYFQKLELFINNDEKFLKLG